MSDKITLAGELVRLLMSVDFMSHMIVSISKQYENELRDSEREVLEILSNMDKTYNVLDELINKVKKDEEKSDATN